MSCWACAQIRKLLGLKEDEPLEWRQMLCVGCGAGFATACRVTTLCPECERKNREG